MRRHVEDLETKFWGSLRLYERNDHLYLTEKIKKKARKLHNIEEMTRRLRLRAEYRIARQQNQINIANSKRQPTPRSSSNGMKSPRASRSPSEATRIRRVSMTPQKPPRRISPARLKLPADTKGKDIQRQYWH